MGGKLIQCWHCGKDFLEEEGKTLCFPCELAIEREKPPQMLLDMRAVYAGMAPTTKGQETVAEMLKLSPARFLSELRGMEREYRAGKKASVPRGTVEPKEKAEPMDAGSKKCLGLIEELLKEWKDA